MMFSPRSECSDLFAQAMAGFGLHHSASLLAVAVSGGGDSMALAFLAHQWAQANGRHIVALTVDHGLRPESAHEAAQTQAWLQARGIEGKILTRVGPVFKSQIQAQARRARYDLMAEECAHRGISHLLLAHTMEDQAETFLMRLARGSGFEGLCAIAPSRRGARSGLILLRPLLDAARSDLRDFLREHSQEWIDDPSNENPIFERVRTRALLVQMTQAGITARSLAHSIRDLQATRRDLDSRLHHLAAQTITADAAGYAVLDVKALERLADAGEAARLVARLIHATGISDYPPPRAALWPLRPQTLGGCRIMPWRGAMVLCRENRNLPAPRQVQAGQNLLWDDRLHLVMSGALPEALTLRPLGEQGVMDLRARGLTPDDVPIPWPVWPSLPALYDREEIFAVPHLGYYEAGNGDLAFSARPRRYWADDVLFKDLFDII